MRFTKFTGFVDLLGNTREIVFDGTKLEISAITLDEAKQIIRTLEGGAQEQAGGPKPAPQTSAKPAAPAPSATQVKAKAPARGEPEEDDDVGEALRRRKKEAPAEAPPTRGSKGPLARRAAALEANEDGDDEDAEEEDAGGNGASGVPASVVGAASLRPIVEWLVESKGTRDPEKLAAWCDELRPSVPVLARIKQESLAGRISRTLQIIDVPVEE